jgi:hypothetical protein
MFVASSGENGLISGSKRAASHLTRGPQSPSKSPAKYMVLLPVAGTALKLDSHAGGHEFGGPFGCPCAYRFAESLSIARPMFARSGERVSLSLAQVAPDAAHARRSPRAHPPRLHALVSDEEAVKAPHVMRITRRFAKPD